ncbi:hypothetical protein HZS_6684 [Henneguya salminicola]|nr:hypothetical protein HZS_6684 [Henneguya salminicola]
MTFVKYLLCGVQNYDWGVKGSSSLVAKLKLGNDHSFTIDEELPYAELWMGAHPKLESVVITENGQINLSKFLNINGKRSLPYMMKVLSINEALSIQVHPDLETAKKLHAHAPAEYPDSNHKPEMAIALTPFAALIGIRPAEEIYNLLKNLTPITKIIKINVLDKLKSMCCIIDLVETQAATAIKTIISDLTSLDSNNVMTVFNQLILHNDNPMHYLFCQLHQQHPYDVGCFFAYFMNYIGEAIFIEPNTIHAYLEGDIIECMALSDNVVRLGLTKKYKDRATMLAIADFIPRSINYFFPTTEITQMDSKNNISITRYLSSKAEFKTTCIKVIKIIKLRYIIQLKMALY